MAVRTRQFWSTVASQMLHKEHAENTLLAKNIFLGKTIDCSIDELVPQTSLLLTCACRAVRAGQAGHTTLLALQRVS
eukprot:513046-Pleurochrysis_carterae.AAC.2